MSIIALYIRSSPWGDVTPHTLYNKGMGGREGALVNLAQEFGKLGHRVFCFVPMAGTAEQQFEDGVVTWIENTNTETMVPVLDIDLFISWEDVPILHAVRPYVKRTALEMQVAHLDDSYDLTPVDHVCVLSEWAKNFFLTQHPEAHDRMVVLPNGIDWELISEEVDIDGLPKKSGPEFIYSSSPDRGLHHLLNMWPKILEKFVRDENPSVPTLHICYGVEKFVDSSAWSHREDSDRALVIANGLSQPGIIYHGKVNQALLAGLHQRCDALLYPADTMQPTETGCITIIEALGAGSQVITTRCDCIPSEFGHLEKVHMVDLPLDYDAYADMVFESYKERKSIGADEARSFAIRRGWDQIAAQWESTFDLDALEMVDR
jgi:glycosyltransferase involved in cell wall biosynthesis